MIMKNKLLFVFIFLAICIFLFGCSTEMNQYSPDQVINNALQEEVDVRSYYAESVMLMEIGKETEEIKMNEWYSSDGKMRSELIDESGVNSITVNNGSSSLTYDSENNTAFILDDPELLALNQPSHREQAEALLDMIGDTHRIEEVGGEKIAGRDTFHIIAIANSQDALVGDGEFWIDKKNWMVLKMVTESGDTKITQTYTTIDFKPSLSPELFTLDLPDDTKIEHYDDVMKEEEITLDDAMKRLNTPFLVFLNNDWELEKVEWHESNDEFPYKQVDILYKRDGLPLLTLGVIQNPEENKEEEGNDDVQDMEIPGIEQVTVRNQKGEFMEGNETRLLYWQEEGFNYSIEVHDPNLTLEELLAATAEMEWVNLK